MTSGVHLRFACAEDAAVIRDIYAPFVTDSTISFELEVPTVPEVVGRMQARADLMPWIVCEQDGTVAGYAYAGPHRQRWAYQWAVEVSVYIHADHRRRRMGRALYTALFALLEAQGFARAYAGVALPNDASVGLHQSMGFEPVGTYKQVGFKFGDWHDVSWWQRSLGAQQDGQLSPPTPFTALPEKTVEAAFALGLDELR